MNSKPTSLVKPLSCLLSALMLLGAFIGATETAEGQFHFYHRFKGFLYSPYGGAYTLLGQKYLQVNVPDNLIGDWYGVRWATDQTPGFEAIYHPFELQEGNKIDTRVTGMFAGEEQEVASAQIELLPDNEAEFTANYLAEMGVSEANLVLTGADGEVLLDAIVPAAAPIRLHNYYWPFCSWRWRCDLNPWGGGFGKFWNHFRFYTHFNVFWNGIWYPKVWNFFYIARTNILPNYLSFIDYRAWYNCAGWRFKCAKTQWYENGPYIRNVGYAYLTPIRPYLTIGNLVGPYWGGARICLRDYGYPGVGYARVLFRGPAGAVPPNTRQVFGPVGTLGNDPHTQVAAATLSTFSPDGTSIELTGDFAPVGANTFTVEVWDNGIPVITVPGQSGLFAQVQEGCRAIEVDKAGDFGTPSIASDWDDPQTIFLPGTGQTFNGDRIVIHAENPTEVLNEVNELEIQGLDSPDIELEGVETSGIVISSVDDDSPDFTSPATPVKSEPGLFTFHPNQPNPFSNSTTIRFDLDQSAFVGLGIYNNKGERVATLKYNALNAGEHSVSWDGTDDAGAQLVNGVYFCRLEVMPLTDEGDTSTSYEMQKLVLER